MSLTDDLSRRSGRDFWQGLDQLVDEPDFRARLEERFPAIAGLALDRRAIFKCLGATIALAGLDGCERQPDETALPFVKDPDGGPGAERSYATAVELDGIGQPVIGKCCDGRPIKLDGNAAHRASGGATDAFTQAALLGLYDPGRSAVPLREGGPVSWGTFESVAFDLARTLDADDGAGFHLVTGPVGSRTLLRQIAALRSRWPSLRWHVHDPLAGSVPSAVLPLDRIETLVALDADPLGPGPLQTIHAQLWSERRRAFQRGEGQADLLVAEPAPTLTGVVAGERLIAGQRRIAPLVWALKRAGGESLSERERRWVEAARQRLRRTPGRALVVLGAHHDRALHAEVEALNATLGASGPASQPSAADAAEPLAALAAAMRAGRARGVFVLDSNPVYSAPADLDFARAFASVPLRVHAGLHVDETAEAAHWHLPLAHLLESWSDVRAADGQETIVQPLVRPFLDVRSRHEVLALLSGEQASGRELVRQTWALGEDEWTQALVRGIVGAAAEQSSAAAPVPSGASVGPEVRQDSAESGLDLIIRPDPCIHDGQFADNPWLQELPKPLTKLTWDNAIHIAPQLADRLGLANEDRAELSVGQDKVAGPIWIVPGMAPDTVLVHLGYGRTAGGQVARDVGFDAYRLRRSEALWHRTGVALRKLDGRHRLACTQTHTAMDGHDFVRFVESPTDALPREEPRANFYPPQKASELAWGMAIDLDLCIGCNACVTACVAENNIPMVGQEQVAMGREMHWLRVDRYYQGPPEDPTHSFQPVPCMHCEDAPCEMGCPVNATVHSPDGLNLQVYNRCIGTRTCSAFCPYKVRRFNWLDYTGDDPPELRAVRNPEVTVRARGVMEKCTYCIQRIEREKIDADADGRPMGEVRTACQQACPTQAIIFGNIADREGEVARAKASGRDFVLLPDANTRPRTSYGARISKNRDA